MFSTLFAGFRPAQSLRLHFFAGGAELPRWMRRTFESLGDDTASIRAFGLDLVTRLCERLLAGGAPGLHFYSMNQAELTLEICRRLGRI